MLVRSRGGVGIYIDYRNNIIVDSNHPILLWKADKERFSPTLFPLHVRQNFPQGLPRIGSQHSEDALSWNVFRSLQLAGKLQLVTDYLPTQMDVEKVYFWQRDADRWSPEIDRGIQDVLNEIEPWGWNGKRQQTETDVILRGRRHILMVESKLGKPGERVKAWERSGAQSRPMRSDYLKFMEKLGTKLFSDSFDFNQDGRRFYQLFRNYLLGFELSLRWKVEFSLFAIVNDKNTNLNWRSHEDEFRSFQSILTRPANTFLITWQQIWNLLQAESKMLPLTNWLAGHPLLCLSSTASLR